WIDPGSPTEAHLHLERDTWDRIAWMDTKIDDLTTERTVFDYTVTNPNHPNVQSPFPSRITKPDGSRKQISMDPSGGGPAKTVTGVTGDTPRRTYAIYDVMGRPLEQGREAHSGTVVKMQYDPAGLLMSRQVPDVFNPGSFLPTTIQYNASQQSV